MAATVVVLLVPAWAEGLPDVPAGLGARGLALVAAIGLSSGIGYALWLWALANTTATRVSMFLALSPITALVLGALWLGEPLPWSAAAGLLLVLAGLWLSAR
jgi:drug/metabolite transporter (DMT)-like permease